METRILALEKKIKKIGVNHNNNVINTRKITNLEKNQSSSAPDVARIKELEKENEILKTRIEKLENQPQAKIQQDIDNLRKDYRGLVGNMNSKMADFRGKYVPHLEQLIANRSFKRRK